MNDVIEKIGQYFRISDTGLTKTQLGLLERSDHVAAARQALAIAPAAVRDRIAGSIGASLQSALELSLADVLSTGWACRRKLLEYRDTAKHPRGEVHEVTLLEHEIRSSHGPTVQLVLAGKAVYEVPFLIGISVVIESAVLRVRDGKIIAASAGSCTGKGSLSCGNTVLVERATAKFSLPAEMVFSPGMPIGALTLSRSAPEPGPPSPAPEPPLTSL